MTSVPAQNESIQDMALQETVERLVDTRVQKAMDEFRSEVQGMLNTALKPKEAPTNRATLVVFNGDMDKLMAAFVIASGAASMGMEVSLYFTFWGLTALKKKTVYRGKAWTERMLGAVLPCGAAATGPSRLNMLGAGRLLFQRMMKQKNVQCLDDLMEILREFGVRMVACQMSMDVMGIKREELLDNVEVGGVATYLGDARDSRVTLFI